MSAPPPDPQGFLPLSPSVFHILLAVSDRERHGYGIIKEVDRRTNGRLVLSTGTLYAAIKRLRQRGLIEKTDSADPEIDDERRRYYRLTRLGRDVVRAETRRMQEMVRLATAERLGTQPAREPGAGG